MNKKYAMLALLLVCTGILAKSCKDSTEPKPKDYHPTPFNLAYPWWFPAAEPMEGNALTVEGVQLGRMLYYDPILSMDGSRACASCHLQDRSFSNNNGGVSVMPHVNLAWSEVFLWNTAIEGDLVDAMLFEVEDFFKTDVGTLQNHREYPELFYRAFGTRQITTGLCAKALAQFVYSLVSSNSPYDGLASGTAYLSEEEMAGFYIFNSEKGDCFHCHTPPFFTDHAFHNTGLDSVYSGLNAGRYLVTGRTQDLGAFKTPGLRNIALSAPYMHDGRFASLEEVIEFYDHGVHISGSTDPIMTKNNKENGLGLSATEKQQLLAFLKTLTDTTFTSNPAYGKP